MAVFTTYPIWFIIFVLLLGLLYAAVLYFREFKNEFPTWLKALLATFRFISVSILAFLLLGPFIRNQVSSQEDPLLILAIDNSASMRMHQDSSVLSNEFLKELEEFRSRYADNFNVRTYAFGAQLDALSAEDELSDMLSFDEKESQLSSLFTEMEGLYTNRNVGAMVMVTDGIFNRGVNPLYASQRASYPVYTVGIGNPSVQRDVVVEHVNYNRLAYLGNEFPVSVTLNAFQCENLQTDLSVYKEGDLLETQSVRFDNSRASVELNFQFRADVAGIARYRIVARGVEDEVTLQNNVRDIFIEVLDAKSNILILYAAPHPDVSAIKEAIRSNLNYEVETVQIDAFDGNTEKYNLMILHQLPGLGHPVPELQRRIVEKSVPYLLIVGEKSNINSINLWRGGLEIAPKREGFEDAVPAFNPAFTLFSLSDETERMISDWPPLLVPFGDYRVQNSAVALLNQHIGTVATTKPLILFNIDGGNRNGIVCGSGMWRWRLMAYQMNEHHYNFNELINKMVQFLAVKENKSRFRVYHMNNYVENEPILFDAEFYDPSYELTNQPEASIMITNEEGNQFPFVFNPRQQAYSLNAGLLEAGNYSYSAELSYGGERFRKNGNFSVSALDIENLNTRADFNMLRSLAVQHDGGFFEMNQLEELDEVLMGRDDMKPVVYSRKQLTEWINLPVILMLLIVLLSLEWFLRKRAGGY